MVINITAFVLLNLTTILILILLVIISRMKNKQEIHSISIGLVFTIFIWCLFMLLEVYAFQFFDYKGMVFTNIYFSAVGFVSVFIFLLGRSFSAGAIINRKYYLLFLFPILNVGAIWTNDIHHLFFIKYSLMNNEIIRGPFINIQAAIAYPLILTGIILLLYFSIKNAGFFSRQSLLIAIATIIPVFVDVSFVFKLFSFSMYYEPISFSIAVGCMMLAILKYDFLNVVPIALQTIVDHISDSYLVVNDNFEIIDFNKTFATNFGGIINTRRKMSIWRWIEQVKEISEDNTDYFRNAFDKTAKEFVSTYFEKHISRGEFDKVFAIEITPVITKKGFKGSIILLKDITEIRRSFELVKQTQAQLIEKEHLISLGQLIGGIAHNFKTPIMSISGGLEGLKDLITEYEESIVDPTVVAEDHLEIAHEMRSWIEKMSEYCSYMSDIISTVKGQAVQLTSSTTDCFHLSELLKRIDILMNHELKRFGCKLNVVSLIEKSTIIRGEVNSLVQIINNLITNSIESYEGKEGEIDLTISQDGPMILISVKDYGPGIPEDIKNRLFKELLTTKAKKGTGLGLYMSYSTIVGKFGGKMWFESEIGTGTNFFILIPVT